MSNSFLWRRTISKPKFLIIISLKSLKKSDGSDPDPDDNNDVDCLPPDNWVPR